MWSRGEAEPKGIELELTTLPNKTKELAAVWVDWGLEVSVLEIDGRHKVMTANRGHDYSYIHPELSGDDIPIQGR